MIDKLEMFIALAREQHFGRAAEVCNVTQPTLSAAVKQLEDQLGVMLVRRGSRFQGLTAEGERVLDWARRIVGDARSMREEMRAVRLGLTGHIRIAVIPTALTMVRDLTTPFYDENPNVTLSVSSRTSNQILSLLENLEIEVGITYLDHEPLGKVASVPLYRERYCLVGGDDRLFEGRESITWKEVSALPLCLLTPDMQNRRIIDSYLTSAGAEVRPTLESDSMISLFSHVLTGNWVSVMPEKLVETFGAGQTVRSIPITGPEAPPVVGLVAAHREPHTPVIEALLALARRISTEPLPAR
ncbi:LysR family transcriptional regulator [uncultured Roseibium sp.]|uniref:LysR family transcriptional regulator n=1 Tax=uncultured Roseibium sp. TaxID=1936171 RepID=UPI00321687DE